MSSHRLGRVALAHDYLNQKGGAERVALALTRIFPGAPLFTSLYRPDSTFPDFREVEVQKSYLDRLPVDEGFRALLPLYPAAFSQLGPVDADTVIASSSGWAHAIEVVKPGRLIVYCHTPARWLYGALYFGASSRKERAIAPLRPFLRRWDRGAAARADAYIANSQATRERLRTIYGIEAPVLRPPVEVDRFIPTQRGERLLVVSRLLPYKQIHLAVEAATRAKIGLDVVGVGPAASDLHAAAGPTVRFHGSVDDATLTELLQGCRALCLPGIEDFGIIAVEAQAAGKPVIAYGAGGAMETVQEGVTGSFFREPTGDALLAAIRDCEALDTAPERIAQSAARFSSASFGPRLLDLLDLIPGAVESAPRRRGLLEPLEPSRSMI